jgi:ABC-2 type transport system permease protein
MNALRIALKDLRIFFKDRDVSLQLFLLPLLFIFVYSGAISAITSSGQQQDTRIQLPVVDLDGGQSAQTLLSELDKAGGVKIALYKEAEAMPLLEEGKLGRVLTIPAGFSAGIAAGQQQVLRLVSHPDADQEKTEAVRLVVQGVVRDMSLESQILASLQQMADMQANASAAVKEAFSIERLSAQARNQFTRSQAEPLVSLVQKIAGQNVEREEDPDYSQASVPGFAVLFIFLTAQATARSVYDEKKVGSFRRLLAAPIAKISLLVGKILPNFLIALVQMAVILAFGVFGLRLLGMTPVPLGRDPLALLLAILLTALCSSAFGLVIAALARTESQIGGLSAVVLWVMGVLGGSFIPVFILDRLLGPVPKVVPHYWANRALTNVMLRGLRLADVTTELAVLALFTAVFFAIGLLRFDFD